MLLSEKQVTAKSVEFVRSLQTQFSQVSLIVVALTPTMLNEVLRMTPTVADLTSMLPRDGSKSRMSRVVILVLL